MSTSFAPPPTTPEAGTLVLYGKPPRPRQHLVDEHTMMTVCGLAVDGEHWIRTLVADPGLLCRACKYPRKF